MMDDDGLMAVGSREYRDLMKDLTKGINDKVGILKNILVKCSDADSSYD